MGVQIGSGRARVLLTHKTHNMVRLTEEGQPGPDAQPEAPKPTNNLELFGSTTFSGVVCSQHVQKFTCMASVRVPDDDIDEDAEVNENERPPVILVAVVDKSGSMAGKKMESLKETLNFVISEMGKKDQLAIVEYDTNVTTSLPLTLMNQDGRNRAQEVCKKIHPGSATNLSGGLMEGLRLVPTNLDTDVVVSTFLLTDGLANHGIRTAKGIVSMLKKEQSKGVGRCTVNTFGFGSDHDAAMLKEIAQAAEGMYYFIENEDSIASAFADCIGGLLSVRAQGVELEIHSSDTIALGEIFTTKEVTTVTAGRKIRIALGDLQNGEERDITFEVQLPSCSATDCQTLANIRLGFFDMKTNEMRDIEATVTVARPSAETSDHQKPNLLVDRNCNRIKGANVLAKALKFAESNQLAQGRELLQNAITEIKQSPSSGEEFCIALLEELQTSLNGMQDRQHYRDFGKYQMNNACHVMYNQRCAAPVSQQPSHSFAAAPQAQQQAFGYSAMGMSSMESSSIPSPPAPVPMSRPMFQTKNRARFAKKCAKK